jgi:hypothetical protein
VEDSYFRLEKEQLEDFLLPLHINYKEFLVIKVCVY